MWVWQELGYDHIAQLPGGALGALGCRCQEAPSDDFLFGQDFAGLSRDSLTEPSWSAPRQEALLNESGEPLRLQAPATTARGAKAGPAAGAWRLTKYRSKYSDLRLCVPGAVELEEPPAPTVEIISGDASGPGGALRPPSLLEALDRLSQQGGGEFWYRAPQVVCNLRSDIADECLSKRAPPEWPLCVVGARIGAAMRLVVVPTAEPEDSPKGGDAWKAARRLSRGTTGKLTRGATTSLARETSGKISREVSTQSLRPQQPPSRGGEHAVAEAASPLLPTAPGSPPAGSRRPAEVTCRGFRLSLMQHGGPPLNVAKLHERDKHGVAEELQRWALKALASHPQTWRTLNVITRDGNVSEDLQAWPGRTPRGSVTGLTSGPAAFGDGATASIGPGAAFRGGRLLGDMVLAASCEMEVSIEPFELSYGNAHVSSMRRMLEDEIGTVLGVPGLMVKCGEFSSSGARGRPKKRHLPREAVTLEVALLCSELAEIARGGPLLPAVAAMPLGAPPAPRTQSEAELKKAKLPAPKLQRGSRKPEMHGMDHRLRQTVMDTEATHQALMATAERKKKVKDFESSLGKRRVSVAESHPLGGFAAHTVPHAGVQAGGLAKSASDPGLGLSRSGLQASLVRNTATKNKDMSPDQLVKLLISTLQESRHPLRSHPDVFPMLARTPQHGVHPGLVVVASRDAVRDSAKSTRSSTLVSVDNLSDLLEQTSRPRSKEVADEVDTDVFSKLSTRRLDILDMYAGKDGDVEMKKQQLIGASEKELLDLMEGAYPNHKSLKVILGTIGDRATADQSCCLRLRSHRAVERITYTMVRFNSDYAIVSRCFFIIESLVGHDLGSVDIALEKGVVPEFIAAINTFRRDNRMQRSGCRVLRRLYTRARETALHGPRIVLLGKNLNEGHTFRGLESIFTAMHTFEDDAVIQLESLSLLAQLGELLYNNGMAERTFKSIEVVMRRHSQHADIMSEGVLIISRLGESFLKVEKRGIHTVAIAMARHRSNRRMQRVGTRALFSLSKNEETLELCRSGGAIGAVLGAMCAHSRDTQTTQMGTRVLEKLAPRALARVFRACGDVASVLPPVSWSEDPLVASVAARFDLGTADETLWSAELLENFRFEVTGANGKRNSGVSISAEQGLGQTQLDSALREGLASAAVYHRAGLAEDLDCTDVLWAVPGLPATRDGDGPPRKDILKKDMSALKQSGCDERVLLAEGPTEEQLRELCEVLRDGRDNNTLGPQDAEFIAGLLGHFAWHSPELAKKVVEFGGAAAFAAWIRMPDYIKQGHNPEDDHLIFPMFRACLTGISCVCRQGAANAQEVLKLDGVVDAALEFADHLERDVKRSALRVLARLMPYGAVSFDKVWRLIFKHILAGEDESVRAAAGACALQAATYGWDTEAPDLEGFAIAMHHGLEQALQGESPAALPYLFTVEHVVLKDGETSDQLIRTYWIHDHEGDEVLQHVGNSNIIVQLAAWLPRGSSSRASPADKACGTIAAVAIEKLAGKGAKVRREELEALLLHASASEVPPPLRMACGSAITEAVSRENDSEMLAQVIACFVEETLPQGKRVHQCGFDGLGALACRVLRLLKERDAEQPAPDTLLQALRRAEPHLEGVSEAANLLAPLREASVLLADLCQDSDDDLRSPGAVPDDRFATETLGEKGKRSSSSLPQLKGR